MKKTEITAMIEKVVAFRNVRDWKQFHTPKDLALSLVLEASELLEHFQWLNDAEQKVHTKEAKTEIGDEMADVLHWLLLMANDFDIDLVKVFERKHKINAKKYPIKKSKGNARKYNNL